MPPNLISEFWPTKVDHFSRKTLFLPKFHSLSYHLGIIAPRAINISLLTPNRSPKLTFHVKFRGVGGLPIKILLFWTYHHDLCSKCLSCFGVFRKIRALFIFTICRAWPAENDSPPSPDLDDWVIPEDRHSMPCCVQFLRVWVIPEDRHSMPCCVQFLRVSSSPARPGTESRRSRPPPRTTRRWMVFLLLPAVEIPMNADDCF